MAWEGSEAVGQGGLAALAALGGTGGHFRGSVRALEGHRRPWRGSGGTWPWRERLEAP